MAAIDHVSPLAPAQFPDLLDIAGASFATSAAGVKYTDRKDVMLAKLAPGTVVAGVFTKSATRSAAVLDCQEKIGIENDQGAAIVVNSGNANAFTGRNGIESTKAVTEAVAQTLGVPENRVFSSSTGVIGEPLPHARITAKLEEMSRAMSEGHLSDAAEAIMTTDTFAKGATRTISTPMATSKSPVSPRDPA
jgi:glutamate N-acetyltransferase/amino-acid N-acetyltransferase